MKQQMNYDYKEIMKQCRFYGKTVRRKSWNPTDGRFGIRWLDDSYVLGEGMYEIDIFNRLVAVVYYPEDCDEVSVATILGKKYHLDDGDDGECSDEEATDWVIYEGCEGVEMEGMINKTIKQNPHCIDDKYKT